MITYVDDTHTYTIDGVQVNSVTQILEKEGLIDYSFIHPDILQRAKEFGNAVHRATELFENNDLDVESLDPALVPYLEQWKKFLVKCWRTIKSEQVVASRKYLYCGRYDRLGLYNDKLTILDIKTGVKDKKSFKVAGLQLAAYELAHNESANKTEKAKQRLSVWLNGDDAMPKTELHTNKGDQNCFLAALTMVNFKEGL